MATKIEWTDEVWNPVTGCTKVSQGCKNCYAERIANRFWKEEIPTGEKGIEYIDPGGNQEVIYYRQRKFTDVICHEDRLDIPLKWRKPRRVFVNSMSDLFHEDVDFGFIQKVFHVMRGSPRHTFHILTKRPEAMYEFVGWVSRIYRNLGNVWLGVSVENQATADERIPWLLKTPAAVRFVSYEPALGPVDFGVNLSIAGSRAWSGGIDWVIAGCESGPGARPAHPDWFRNVRDQCVEAGVPFFLKQMTVDGKLVKLPELDGKVWNEYPEAH